jgi:hypothetical protein
MGVAMSLHIDAWDMLVYCLWYTGIPRISDKDGTEVALYSETTQPESGKDPNCFPTRETTLT